MVADQGTELQSMRRLSMREKSLLKKRISAEHNSNFRTGYVHIDEDYLHKTGLRGRKRYCLYCLLAFMFVVALGNLLATIVIILAWKIDYHGMKALEFIPPGVLLRFKQTADLGVIVARRGIGGLADQDFDLSGYNDNPVIIGSRRPGSERRDASLEVGVNSTVISASDSVRFTNPVTGATFFDPTWDEFTVPAHIRTLVADEIVFGKVTGPTDGDLRLTSESTIRVLGHTGVEMKGKQVELAAAGRLLLQSTGRRHITINSEQGVYVNASALPHEDGKRSYDAVGDTYQLCACARDGRVYKLFRATVMGSQGKTCARAGRDACK